MDVDRWNEHINLLNPQSLVARNFELSGPLPPFSLFLITAAVRLLILGQNHELVLAFTLKWPQRCFLKKFRLHLEFDLRPSVGDG